MKFIALALFTVLALASAGQCPHGQKLNGGYSKTQQVTYKAGICPISGAQLGTLRLALKAANKDGNLGAKVGLRYLQAHPEAKMLFPTLKSAGPADLMQNSAFVAKSSVCFAAVRQLFSDRYFDKTRGCPYTAKTRGHYTTAQQLDFGKALVETVVAELGASITPEIKGALQATVRAVRAAAGVGGRCPVSESDREVVRATLKAANVDGSLGPKAFAKYFEVNPAARNAFGAGDYSVKAATCVNAFQLYFSPGFHSTSAGCPFIERTKGRYSMDDLKQFRIALISAIKDTLGDKLSTEAKQAFQNAYAIAEARRKA